MTGVAVLFFLFVCVLRRASLEAAHLRSALLFAYYTFLFSFGRKFEVALDVVKFLLMLHNLLLSLKLLLFFLLFMLLDNSKGFIDGVHLGHLLGDRHRGDFFICG